ncbi:MAG: hypothetical protein H3C52_12930 [Anaerolineales bacterium]|nr:hypothetical protein [Anaerolineales bacterium]MCZ2287375.1 hypothetical protein [Anaerolineales bacterium]
MKNHPLLTFSVGLALIMLTVGSVGFYIFQPQSPAVADSSANLSSEILANPVNSQALQTPIVSLSKTVNELTVEITSAKIIETGVEIGVCYTMPDGGDWYLTPGHLFYEGYDIYPDEFEFTNEQAADGRNFGKRCALVRYRIDNANDMTLPVQFSVLDIYSIPREMYSACKNFQQRLATNPKARAYGLKAKCVESSDGGITVALTEHDNSITNEKAKETLDAISSGVAYGPWEFTITVLEK